MSLSSKDLLGIKGMTVDDEIKLILDTAATFRTCPSERSRKFRRSGARP